jgi:HAD superfamily hydrolase (TIGR01662 family)
MPIRSVFFDLGETLIDETRHWEKVAAALDVPLFTLAGVIGAFIERGAHHREAYEQAYELFGRRQGDTNLFGGDDEQIWQAGDLYSDAVPCLQRLRNEGYFVGIAGNQPASMESAVRALQLPVDTIASSARWGIHKPSPAFFERIISVVGSTPEDIVYVGDRLDNDILPAAEAGMKTVFIRRGPWGYLHAQRPEVAVADVRVDSLDELPACLAALS